MQRVVVAEKLRGEFQRIPIELIQSGGSREIFEDISSLAATVREHGLLEPILVRKLEKGYGYRVVCGERRLRACRKAELQTVPAIILDEKVTEEEILEFQLIENLQRSDLKPFEEIKLVKQLKDRFQLSNAEIAAKIGVSESTIGDYLSITQALPEKNH